MARTIAHSVMPSCLQGLLVYKDKDRSSKIASFKHDMLQYDNNLASEKENFIDEWQICHPHTDALGTDSINTISSALDYWARNASFYTCQKCNSKASVKMPYNFCNRPNPSQRNKCVCSSRRYHVPGYAEIPSELLDLSTQCTLALRPFHLDCGMYSRKRMGIELKQA